jgi:hypothetical protein
LNLEIDIQPSTLKDEKMVNVQWSKKWSTL